MHEVPSPCGSGCSARPLRADYLQEKEAVRVGGLSSPSEKYISLCAFKIAMLTVYGIKISMITEHDINTSMLIWRLEEISTY